MQHRTSSPTVRNWKVLVSLLVSYLILIAPLVPVAAAASRTRLQTSASSRSSAERQQQQPAATATAPQAQNAAAPLSLPAPTPNAPSVVTVSATLDDAFPSHPSGKAEPGDTINYTLTITNSGDTAATGVSVNDSLDGNTTFVGNSAHAQPQARPETYTTVGNTLLEAGVTPSGGPAVASAVKLFDNDAIATDTSALQSFQATSANGGTVSVNADGSFTYLPPVGFTGTDTFTYTVRNTAATTPVLTDTATVTINVNSKVWYVNSAAAGGGDGRSSSPFNSLASVTGATGPDGTGDIIYLFSSGTNYTGGITLLNNQQLIGGGVALVVNTFTLKGAGTRPNITNAGGNGVTLANTNTLSGFNIGDTSAIDISGSSFGTLTANNITLGGTGRPLSLTTGAVTATFDSITATSAPGGQGIMLSGVTGTLTSTGGTSITSPGTQCVLIGTTTAAVDLGNTTCSGGTDGLSFQNNSSGTRTFGTLNVSGGSGTAFLSGAGGGNVTVSGAATLSSTGSVIDIQNMANGSSIGFNGGATVSKTTAGGAGINWGGTNTGATLGFSSLGLTTSNGPGLVAAGGGTINVTTGTISSTGGAAQAAPAINVTSAVAFGATFTNVSSTNSGNSGNGISLTGLTGTLTINAGTITGAAGDAFVANGGTANITYNGTIGTTAARPVNISNKTGGTVAFGGAITSTSNGVSLTTNTGATINFTGGLSLTTGANAAFTATGGGTVNATQNNTSILNVVSTTTGTGVNIQTPTNIGASGVTFRSVTVNNGASNSAANGIILSGTTGAFLISGDGTQTGGFFNRNGSGGTINRTTGHSVSLTNATNVTLRQLNITNTAAGGACPAACTANAVNSTTGGNIVLSAVTLQNLGGNGWLATNITGANAINNNSLISTWNTAASNGVSVANTSTAFTASSFTVDRCLFTTSATGADAFLFDVDANAGGGTVTVTNSEFTLIDQDAIQINHDGTGILNAAVQTNNLHDADATGGDGNNTMILAVGGGGQLNFTVSNNTLTNLARLSANQGVLQVQAAGGSAGSAAGAKLNGSIQNNTLTNPGFVSQRRGIMAAAEASAGNHGGHSILISGNSVQNFQLHGIYVSLASVAGQDCLNNNITISNNQAGNISPVGIGGGDSGSAIEFETLIDADGTGGDISANALIQGNTAVSNNNSGIGDTLEITNRSGVTTGAGNSSTLNLTVLGNNLTQQNAGGQVFEVRNSLAPTTTVCLDLNAANTSPNTVTGGVGGFRLTNDAGTFSIEGLGAQTPSAHLSPKNNGGTVTASGSFINSAGCANSTAMPEIIDVVPITDVNGVLPPQQTATATTSTATQPSAQDTSITSGRPFVSLPRSIQQPAAPKTVATTGREQTGTTTTTPAAETPAKTTAPDSPTANFPVSVGTIQPGESVIVLFQATINDPLPGNVTQISNQATISGSNFSNVVSDDPATGTANDPTITPVAAFAFAINDVSIAEGAVGQRQAVFTISMTNVKSTATSVHVQTADGSATAGVDYVAVPDTLVTIPGNAASTTVTVLVNGDTIFEGNRTFTVNLSNATGASILDGQATGTIADDEPQVADISGDGFTDAAIWNSNNGNWFVVNSGTSTATLVADDWGRAALGDVAVPGDYDGDNKIDIAVFRVSEGNWYIQLSSGAQPNIRIENWGQTGDKAVPGDFDGDGKTDVAVFRPSEGKWYIKKSTGGTTAQNWGISTDKPVVGDFDGDGKSDLAVFRIGEGNWYILNSGSGVNTTTNWGLGTDKLVPGDYDGDGKTDLAVYRNGTWFIKNSRNGTSTVKSWGESTDLPIPGDYDGDGKFDISIWRPSEGKFYTIRSNDNTVLLQTIEVGGAGIVPVPNAYLPQ